MSSDFFKYALTYDPRLASDQLGKEKYSKPNTAFFELISNSFDADASVITIDLNKNALDGWDSISVTDDGKGMSHEVFKEKFLRVGLRNNQGDRFGKFGLGRFSVFRLGSKSEWSTVFKIKDKDFQKTQFHMDDSAPDNIEGNSNSLKTAKTGTRIKIFNLWEDVTQNLSEKSLRNDILANFFVYLIGNRKKKISVNNTEIDVNEYIQDPEVETVKVKSKGKDITITLTHLWIKKAVERENNKNNLLLFGDGKLVYQSMVESTTPSNYLCLADSKYFSELAVSNRESIATLDPIFNLAIEQIQKKITTYQLAKQNTNASMFLEDARKQDFYPYRNMNPTAQLRAKQALYDVALEKINEHADIVRLTKKAQAVIFRLLDRAMTNSNILEVLEEVAKLSDVDVDKFRRVLERTTLEQIIRLSDEVTRRLDFLNSLHDLTYGKISKKLKERKELHKILEQHVWIFGEKYQLATSDKSFRALIGKHRAQLKLRDYSDAELSKITDYDKIPDLYLASQRAFPVEPKFHNLIVELKAPKVKIAEKEVAQIKKYAEIVKKSPELVKENAVWELILVSSDVAASVDTERSQSNRPMGLLIDTPAIKVWVFKWSELIQKSREEMMIVSNHLKLKTDELSVSEDLKREFPFLQRSDAAVF